MGKKRKAPKQNTSRTPKMAASDDEEDPGDEIFTDEISDFTEARNKVDLDDREEASEDEEGLFGLLSDDAESDEELGEWSKRLKQMKFQTKIDKQKQKADAPEKSWGKKRIDFYGSGVHRKPKDTDVEEEDEWLLEEQEVKSLQRHLDQDMEEEDFLVPALNKKKVSTNGELSVARELTESEKQQYKRQTHPESEPLREELNSCLEKVQKLRGRSGWLVERRDTVYRLLGANIAFYLHLLETGEDIRGHPVLKRILQWKKLAKIFDSVPAEDDDVIQEEEESTNEIEANTAKRARLALGDSENESSEHEEDLPSQDSLLNRPVTYEIEKNKPKKKTAPNNPRVKHREKYRKAKIRRKGKIRDYRPEVNKYQGEASGIRAGIVRSVKLN